MGDELAKELLWAIEGLRVAVLGLWHESTCRRGRQLGAKNDGRARPLTTYCVEKVERQRFQEVSDVRRIRDRSIAAVLISPGRQDFCPRANLAEFFNTINPKRTLPTVQSPLK